MNKKTIAILAAIIGVIFVIIAIVYFVTPAKSLPFFLPGYQAGLAKTHFRHGIGSLLLGLALFAYAWFQTGKKINKSENNPPAATQ